MRRGLVGSMGVVATLLLHSMFFAVVIWGDGVRKAARLPDAVGAGANFGKPDGSSTERMILIRLSLESSTPQPEPSQTPQLTAAAQQSMLEVTGADSIPLPPLVFEKEGEATEASDADLIARTKLAGLYESQIRARIERAWTQPPRELYATSAYSCRVKVRQKRDGQIEDVILENCEGSFQWLDSLVRAIYSASPLPGAPHPGVFADSFSMQFRSAAVQSH